MIVWTTVIVGLIAYALHRAVDPRLKHRQEERPARDSLDLSFLHMEQQPKTALLLQLEAHHQAKVDQIEQLWHGGKPIQLRSKTDSVILVPQSKEYAAFVAGLKHATRELQKLPIDYPEGADK